MSDSHELVALRSALAEIADLQAVEALLLWDQATYLPSKAGEGRSRQLSTMAALIHEKFTSPRPSAVCWTRWNRTRNSLRPMMTTAR